MRRLLTLWVIPCLLLPLACDHTLSRTVPVASVQPAFFPVPIIQLSGDPATIGQIHGQRLGADILYLDEKYLHVYLGTPTKRIQAMMVAASFKARMLPEHRSELDAMADAANINRGEMTLAQCFLDLTHNEGCSTIALSAEASPDHVARFGRNLDFSSFHVLDNHSVLFIYHPQNRYAFASIGWPGMVGAVSGMNEYGLCLANMEVPRPQRIVASGMPYTLLYRTILERCRTVNEAIELLQSTPRQTANNLMLMDASGDRAVAEITPDTVTIRRAPETAALVSTNHQRGRDLDTPGFCNRFDCLHDQAKARFGHIDEPALQSLLGQVAQGDYTIQSMVFEPANRILYLAAGTHATCLRYGRIDLKPCFQQ